MRWLLLLAWALWLALPAEAHYTSPMRTETVQAGPYVLEIGFFADPLRAGRELDVLIDPRAPQLPRLTIEAQPAPGVVANPVRAQVAADFDDHTRLNALFTIPVAGRWTLIVKADGERGRGEARLPLEVAGPPAIPIWLGWLLGMTPLLLWVAFVRGALRRAPEVAPMPWGRVALAVLAGAGATAALLALAAPAPAPHIIGPFNNATLPTSSVQVHYILPRGAHHGHLRVDDGAMRMVYGEPAFVTDLAPGPHRVTLVAADGAHQEYGPTSTVRFRVAAPGQPR